MSVSEVNVVPFLYERLRGVFVTLKAGGRGNVILGADGSSLLPHSDFTGPQGFKSPKSSKIRQPFSALMATPW